MINTSEQDLSYFQEQRITKWEDLFQWIRPKWIFRGQRNADWPLMTSLERTCGRFEVSFPDRPNVESELRREFRRAYHDYAMHVPDPQYSLEWLSLMQHHGAPTRLLDFSYSIFVAAYFAVEDGDADAALWAINGQWALERSVGLLTAKLAGADKLLRRFNEGDEKIVEPVIFEKPYIACACPLNPFRLNERLRIQKGVFLVSGTVTSSFMANLRALPDASSINNVIRLRIPGSVRKGMLRNLRDMNISHTSLFPGLDGYGRSLGVYHQILDDPQHTGIGSA